MEGDFAGLSIAGCSLRVRFFNGAASGSGTEIVTVESPLKSSTTLTSQNLQCGSYTQCALPLSQFLVNLGRLPSCGLFTCAIQGQKPSFWVHANQKSRQPCWKASLLTHQQSFMTMRDSAFSVHS